MNYVLIEPYYGGSHRAFFDAFAEQIGGEFRFHTLPAQRWKLRMRLSAPYFANRFAEDPSLLKGIDGIVCSSFLDVATFKGLLPVQFRKIPIYTYFHENQFVYPVTVADARDIHFSLTNLTTALSSDFVAFNSRFNLNSFVDGCEHLFKLGNDMVPGDWRQQIQRKVAILHPGIDFRMLDSIECPKKKGIPVIVWNHRWEHDKNPELFFETLFTLAEQGVDFRLIVLGQSFRQQPSIFAVAQKRLQKNIIHFGYVSSRQEYLRLLTQGDIVVSTAKHEFYGISIIEAVRAGCHPLLPNRLSYPELFARDYLYQEKELTLCLHNLLTNPCFSVEQGRVMTEKFSWGELLPSYRQWLGQ